MLHQIINEILLPMITGACAGLSGGIGLWPVYEQPKNLKIQVALGVIGIGLMAVMIYPIITK